MKFLHYSFFLYSYSNLTLRTAFVTAIYIIFSRLSVYSLLSLAGYLGDCPCMNNRREIYNLQYFNRQMLKMNQMSHDIYINRQNVMKGFTVLAGRPQTGIVSLSKMTVRKEPTPFVKSWSQNPVPWKCYDRSASTSKKSNKNNQKKGINIPSKINRPDLLRQLLIVEQGLNTPRIGEKIVNSARKRSETHTSNSTRRRLCLQSHMEIKKDKQFQTLALLNRQSSGGSQLYLQAKLQFQKRPPSSLNLKILSM